MILRKFFSKLKQHKGKLLRAMDRENFPKHTRFMIKAEEVVRWGMSSAPRSSSPLHAHLSSFALHQLQFHSVWLKTSLRLVPMKQSCIVPWFWFSWNPIDWIIIFHLWKYILRFQSAIRSSKVVHIPHKKKTLKLPKNWTAAKCT